MVGEAHLSSTSCCLTPTPHHLVFQENTSSPLLGNRSKMPKRLGTSGLRDSFSESTHLASLIRLHFLMPNISSSISLHRDCLIYFSYIFLFYIANVFLYLLNNSLFFLESSIISFFEKCATLFGVMLSSWGTILRLEYRFTRKISGHTTTWMHEGNRAKQEWLNCDAITGWPF